MTHLINALHALGISGHLAYELANQVDKAFLAHQSREEIYKMAQSIADDQRAHEEAQGYQA